MSPTLVCIVEGHGEVQAVPLLLRRFATEAQHHDLTVPTPIRCPSSKIIRPNGSLDAQELDRAVKLAAYKLSSIQAGAVLLLLDAHDDCPADIGPRLRELVRKIRSDVCFSVILAKREYEAWLIAALVSLRGTRGIREDAVGPTQPEEVADAKGYLSERMEPLRKYSPVADQPALTQRFSFAQAEACRSFHKLRTELDRIFAHLYPEDTG